MDMDEVYGYCTIPCSPYTYELSQICDGPSFQLEVATVFILVFSICMALATVLVRYSILHYHHQYLTPNTPVLDSTALTERDQSRAW